MKTNWQTKKLGEVCEVVNGGTPKTNVQRYWDGSILWITPKDMGKLDSFFVADTERKITEAGLKNSSAKVIPADSIILSTRAPIGHLAINKKEITTNQGCKGLIPKNDLNVYFLFYFLKMSVDLLNSLGSGTTFKELSGTKLKEVEIPLPPLPEQQCIVAILDEAFAAIATAKENAEKNLQNARELFESYLQGVFANQGDGWEEKKLGEVCDLKSGTTIPKKFEEILGPILYVKVGDMNLVANEICINTSSRFVDMKNIKQNQIIPKGSVIFPKRGGAIFTNKRRKIIKPTIVDLNTMALVPSELINSDLLYYWFLRIDLTDLNNGSSIPQINNYSFDNIYISYPKSLSEQKTIVAKLDALSTETKKLEDIYRQKLNDLDELKKSVLQKAFNGGLA